MKTSKSKPHGYFQESCKQLQLKQYALNNDRTLTATVIEACNDFLAKRKKR